MGQLVEATLNTEARVVAHKDLLEVLLSMLVAEEAEALVHQVGLLGREAHGEHISAVMLLPRVVAQLAQARLHQRLELLVRQEILEQAMAAVVEDFPQEATLAVLVEPEVRHQAEAEVEVLQILAQVVLVEWAD